ncbi:hypothetical protein QBC41DRAFT_358693 [Cercophora samala]|uniref:Uncharacterized protein n=1 Tax=Cercophora samala TaxID=330535 RepID=A0AA40D7D2_9PEZI|nr:hypothetical protein QBC41DRAFT_358693 [Cercophora samala]
MVTFTSLLASTLGLLASTAPLLASAQMLGVIETNPQYFDSRTCYDGAKTHSIVDFGGSHAPSTGSTCTNRGTVLSIQGGSSNSLDTSCTAGRWSNGYKFCVIWNTPMVVRPDGRVMSCSADDTMIFNCPSSQPCWVNKMRKYKCSGTWA